MTRKIAMTIAGALIASMLAGVVALTLHSGIVGTPAAGAAVARKPIVKTETRVVTVRKRRPARNVPVKTVTVVRPGSGSSVASPGSTTFRDDDGLESHDDTQQGGDD